MSIKGWNAKLSWQPRSVPWGYAVPAYVPYGILCRPSIPHGNNGAEHDEDADEDNVMVLDPTMVESTHTYTAKSTTGSP